MKYLLDPSTCIDYLRYPHSRMRERLKALAPSEVALCTIVPAKLYYGAWRSQNPTHNLNLLEAFFEPFHVLPFCSRAAQVYGTIRARSTAIGQPIGPHDLLIAAIALANGVVLVTNNIREFARVPDLVCEDWTV